MMKRGPPTQMGVIKKNGKVLILRFSDYACSDRVTGKWVFPGGALEDNETMINGVIREVKEETGLDVKVLEPIYVDTLISKVTGSLRPILFYSCEIIGDDEVTLSNEHTEYKWVNLKEIINVDWVDESFIRFIKKQFF